MRCNQPELSLDTMDSDSVANGNVDTAPADGPATSPLKCAFAPVCSNSLSATDTGTLLSSCATYSSFFVG